MAMKEIGPVIKRGDSGDSTPWGSVGSLAGGALGAIAGAFAGNPMAGAALGSTVGGMAGGVAAGQFADKPTADKQITPVRSAPLTTFADRNPEVAVAQLKRAQMALPEAGLPADQRDAYNKMMQDATARIMGG